MFEEVTGARHRRAFRRGPGDLPTSLPGGTSSTDAGGASPAKETTSAAEPTTTSSSSTSETPTTTSSSSTETTSSSSSTETTSETTPTTTSTSTSSTQATTTSDLISGLVSGVLGGGTTTSSSSTSKTTSSKTATTAEVTPPAAGTDLTTSSHGPSTYVQTIQASGSSSGSTPSSSSDAANGESNSNTGTIIGAVAGGLVGVAVLATIISFLIRRFNRRRIERDASQFDEDAFRKSAVMLDEDKQDSLFTPRPPPTPAMTDRGYGASLYANQNQAPGRSVSPIPSYNQSYSEHQYPQSPPPAQYDAYYGGGHGQAAMHPYDPMSPQGYYGEQGAGSPYDPASSAGYEQHYQAYEQHASPYEQHGSGSPYEQQASYPRMASVSEHATNVEEVPTRKSVTPFQADQYIDDHVAPAQEATRITSPTVPAGLPAALMPGGKR